jgi:hypothetical protein
MGDFPYGNTQEFKDFNQILLRELKENVLHMASEFKMAVRIGFDV